MPELLLALFSWIKLLGGYPVPAHVPTVNRVTHAYIETQACTKPCPAVAWFPPGDQIYLDDRLRPEEEVRARGILLHELVHYVQQVSGKFDGLDPCEAAIAREREAYAIQNRWLATQGVWPGQATPLHLAPCQPERTDHREAQP